MSVLKQIETNFNNFPLLLRLPKTAEGGHIPDGKEKEMELFYQNNKNLTIQVRCAFASSKIIMFEMFRTGKYLSDGMQSRVRVFANLKMEMKVFIWNKNISSATGRMT